MSGARPGRCGVCGKVMRPAPGDRDCGGDCEMCMAQAGDPDCIRSVLEAGLVTEEEARRLR